MDAYDILADQANTGVVNAPKPAIPDGSPMTGGDTWHTSAEVVLEQNLVTGDVKNAAGDAEQRVSRKKFLDRAEGDKSHKGQSTYSCRIHPTQREDLKDKTVLGTHSVPYSSHNREILTVQLGRPGINFGMEFWRDVAEEHYILYNREQQAAGAKAEIGRFIPNQEGMPHHSSNVYLQCVETYFNESSEGKYVPRAILADTDAKFIDGLRQQDIYRLLAPMNVVHNDKSTGNCWAKAFHTVGPPLAKAVCDLARREVERMDSWQATQILHGMAGGAGSGLSSLILEAFDEHLKSTDMTLTGPIIQTFSLMTHPNSSSLNVEPYNATLNAWFMQEYAQQCFMFDNLALQEMVRKAKKIEIPEYSHCDAVIGMMMSGLTANLRFPGALDADFRKMNTNLVPFQNLKFLVTGGAPLRTDSQKYGKVDIQPLVQKHWRTARYLGLFMCFRGKAVSPSEIDKIIYGSQHHPYFDDHFPDWIPGCCTTSICDIPPPPRYSGNHKYMVDASLTYAANTTAITQPLEVLKMQFEQLMKKKAFLHNYYAEGCGNDDLLEAKESLEYVYQQYKKWASVDDNPFSNRGADEAMHGDQSELIQTLSWLKERKRMKQKAPSKSRYAMGGRGSPGGPVSPRQRNADGNENRGLHSSRQGGYTRFH
uniref:Tubulin beta chain n=1 Tax=Chromera velia CCMP2878 TaxID=1169474 RepID=A0A0G4FKT0_9ALVE|eukprot:Cvel_17526.t1-p1 / transcript=Cvel_17526.t1 / gene=Cvel_17526 / organism=Chromera_velia_CCMP2878 / gene_product=Tubulin beta-6 chain, putative / transcript_product=Tubulin beta-6 chain, putative / location=Cvel_scaffold1405:12527-16758(-) / protein_length=650 / sequence_SO=supercontig / SO=protein_coding / is_pseudo=false